MRPNRTFVAEFTIRNEILDWFLKVLLDTIGPELDIRRISNNGHFNTCTHVEISGSETDVNEAVELLRRTSDVATYRMPWLNDNTYIVKFNVERELAEKKLQLITDSIDYDVSFICTKYFVIGNQFVLFHFRPDLDDAKRLAIEKIFKSLAFVPSPFLTHLYTRIPTTNSPCHMTTNVLTALHGEFLNYLSLEDILSLELANKGNHSCYDTDLDHDIQNFLAHRFSELYGHESNYRWHLQDFRIPDVLRYFLFKYHAHLTDCFIPNILGAGEIESLSHSYHLEIKCHTIIHIDFTPTHDLESVDFCAIYHFDPNRAIFPNYNTNSATQNYSQHFKYDDSLDSLTSCSGVFSVLAIKSRNNCSVAKLHTMLKYVAENFTVAQHKNSELLLNGFPLDRVPIEILRPIIVMMRDGWLKFDQINIELKTFTGIVEQCDRGRLQFRACNIVVAQNIAANLHRSAIQTLWFSDMVIELEIFRSFKNIGDLQFQNCRISSTNWEVAIDCGISHEIRFIHCDIDNTNLLRLFNALPRVPKLIFLSCALTSGEIVDNRRRITVRNEIYIQSTSFKLETLYKILERCVIEKHLVLRNCHFRHDYDANAKFALPVKIQFHNIKFESKTFLAIFETLHKNSNVWIYDSSVSPLGEHSAQSSKPVRFGRVHFINCRLDKQTLFHFIGRTCNSAVLVVDRCELLAHSTVVYPNICAKLSELYFRDTELSTYDLFAVLGILKQNSSVAFVKCVVRAPEYRQLHEIHLDARLKISFSDMTLDSQTCKSLLQTYACILFISCSLNSLTDYCCDILIQSHVTFRNMAFQSASLFKLLARFTATSKIEFQKCHFDFTTVAVPNIVLQPQSILFVRITIDQAVLVKILERIAEHTKLIICECDIQARTQIFSITAIKISRIRFENMRLEINTLLTILANFNGLQEINFTNCIILHSNRSERPNVKIKSVAASFEHMDIGVDVVREFMQHCANGMTVRIHNCKILSVSNYRFSCAPVEINYLVLTDVNYTPELLHILRYSIGQFIVQYYGELTQSAIAEICTKTTVYGKRLQLFASIYTKSFLFDLFAEFFRLVAMHFEMNAEYDPPVYLIPGTLLLLYDRQYWNSFKIRFVPVNEACVKLEFLRDGKPIDLFFELNDVPDNSDVCCIDYC